MLKWLAPNYYSINDFLVRAWLQKPEYRFCGVPNYLMVTKTAEQHFPEIKALTNELNLTTYNPPSGFASGMKSIPDWEKCIRYNIAHPIMENFSLWNPRVTGMICAIENEEKTQRWLKAEARVPDDSYTKIIAETYCSDKFKFTLDYDSLRDAASKIRTN